MINFITHHWLISAIGIYLIIGLLPIFKAFKEYKTTKQDFDKHPILFCLMALFIYLLWPFVFASAIKLSIQNFLNKK